MSMDWFRSHHGAPTDPKWLLIAKRANVRPIHVIGTWWALLDYASQHSERGSIDGFDTETFALFAGLDDEHVSRIVTSLRDKGLIVGDQIAQWGKRQPKREDETAGARKRRERAKTGGKPPPKGGAEIPSGDDGDDCHTMSRNVTTDKTRLDESSSVANATGTVVPHPAADFAKAIFDSGVALLTATGATDRNARALLGRLRKSLNDDAQMLIILRQAETEQPSDPAAWLAAAVETRNGRKPNSGTSRSRSGLVDALRRAQAEERSAKDQDNDPGAWLALPSSGNG